MDQSEAIAIGSARKELRMNPNGPHISRMTPRLLCLSAAVLVLASAAGVSAHRVTGVNYPTLATALVQSPTANPADLPIPIFNTGLSVICFRVTNTSPVDTRITAVGLELPGTLSGFALLTPLANDLNLYENVSQVAGFPDVTLDVVVATGTNFTGGRPRLGIPPGTTPTWFCLSGPFDPTTPIETLLNGVFVRFEGGNEFHGAADVGVWERRPR